MELEETAPTNIIYVEEVITMGVDDDAVDAMGDALGDCGDSVLPSGLGRILMPGVRAYFAYKKAQQIEGGEPSVEKRLADDLKG